MVMAEIGFSGYYNPKRIYIINEFISQKLPKEINLNIKYINLDKLENILKILKNK
jgi:5-bromo-4-chloroindolyl phosphate hydrolysis protein